ncbi:MAG: PSD1 and planctomycete cytochrome C domain-containing protein [Chthoniobacteraceae bacterium]
MKIPLRTILPVLSGFAAAVVAAPVDFVRDVRPIFEKHCHECHGEKKQKSGLRLDVKSAAMKGGDEHGASIIAGKAQESPLLKLITSTDKDEWMPPKGDRLPAAEVATVTRWINEGAPWPDGADLVKLKDKRDHWSFKPLSNPAPPGVKDTAWPRGEIDRFILARLEKGRLHPSAETDRVSWLRRVSFDLTGLPPTPAQFAAFVNDKDENAFERAVDALLASPRYGERWAQHWLDVVRYADTHGFEVNTERPNAWPYRDYVIRAFNSDTPYDRFIREQIAGDAMGEDAATGFLVTASVLLPGQIGKDEPSLRLARQDSLDEIVMNIGQTFLGLSVGCARCHDHKFDPIPQRDYYAMQAFVAGVEYKDRKLRTPEAEAARQEAAAAKARIAELDTQLARFVPLAKAGAERPPVNPRENTDRFTPMKAKRVRFTIKATNNLEPCIDELEVFDTTGRNVALASEGSVPSSSGNIIVADRHDLKHINDGLYGNSRSWMSNENGGGWVALEFAQEHTIDRVVWGRDRDGKFKDRLATDYVIEIADASGEWRVAADSTDRRKFDPKDKKPVEFSSKGLTKNEGKEAADLMRERTAATARMRAAEESGNVFAGTFRTPDEIHVLNRGDAEQPKDLVTPAVLSAIGSVKLPNETDEQARRKALADWIASPRNPLTARVMVNRIWQGHFGTGLVETPSDFGNSGLKPTHPELLDWLAGEFIRSGWSVKHMHRLIVLSAAYRQSSAAIGGESARLLPSAATMDADVRLLWRFPSLRLEAEMIHDSMLAVSGQLNTKMYGRGFDLFDKRGGLSGFRPVENFTGDGLRRMIYAHKVRREREAVFGAFDCPDAGQSTARRRESTTPIQALNLLNSRFTLDASGAFATLMKREAGDDTAAQIRRAYQSALSRDPSGDELRDAETIVRTHGLATLCRALFNSNEFLFVP